MESGQPLGPTWFDKQSDSALPPSAAQFEPCHDRRQERVNQSGRLYSWQNGFKIEPEFVTWMELGTHQSKRDLISQFLSLT